MFLSGQRINSTQVSGQSMIELAVILSVLLLLLTGMIEFGVLLNQYIDVQDAARAAAREASVADPVADLARFLSNNDSAPGVPVIVRESLKPLQLSTACPNKSAPGGPGNPCDDIVISVYSVAKGQAPKLLFSPPHSVHGNRTTKFTPAQIGARLDANAPNTGLVVVEIYYSYPQILKLPFLSSIVPDPIPLHVFAIMPLSAAEPTPTPRP
mgnify:CR=1 FL=1